MSGYTPGVWTGGYVKDGQYIIEAETDGGLWLVGKTNSDSEQDKANALLMAASPEMLELIRTLKHGGEYPDDIIDKIDAVIAKAEGLTSA